MIHHNVRLNEQHVNQTVRKQVSQKNAVHTVIIIIIIIVIIIANKIIGLIYFVLMRNSLPILDKGLLSPFTNAEKTAVR